MADERPAGFPPLPEFDPAKFYRVQLFRPAEVGGRRMSPAARQVVRGSIAVEIASSIYSAEETAQP